MSVPESIGAGGELWRRTRLPSVHLPTDINMCSVFSPPKISPALYSVISDAFVRLPRPLLAKFLIVFIDL
ncbi:MAG: hypothetical protein LUH47_07495 [Clostridiales bacterium]|nr:hypothetical protein [Clostridiales bacterium]